MASMGHITHCAISAKDFVSPGQPECRAIGATPMNFNFLNSIWKRRSESEALPVACLEPDAMHLASRQAVEHKETDPRRFIARQPILDLHHDVYGYELLFRSGWENCFSGDTDEATRLMIADGALYGFHDLTRGAPTFINCTHESLVNGLVTLLPTSTVLEIVETIDATDEVLAACAHYKRLGYKLALDDFQLRQGVEGLIALADYVKVDFNLSGPAERRQILAALKGKNIILLAEKIETEEEFEAAKSEGFTLFQGYFFCHPTVFSKQRFPANGANYLYLLSALLKGDFQVSQLALMLQSEVALSYQLLRLVNSAIYAVDKEVASLEDALVIVGENKFRILLLNAIATETCRSRPTALLVHVLHRARFFELIAPYTQQDPMEQYLFGLLSIMDVMLGAPIADLLEALPLRKELVSALCGEPSLINRALRLFESYEAADWEDCMNASFALGLTERELTGLYTDALVWAQRSVYLDHAQTRRTH